ncbi:hypothetical protein GCM10009412_31410 [Aeromonas salmonicida subsp. achromogenes]
MKMVVLGLSTFVRNPVRSAPRLERVGWLAGHLLMGHRPGAQHLDAEEDEVGGPRQLDEVEQPERLLDQQADPQQGVGHMDADPGRYAERRQHAGATGEQQAVARHHGKIGPRADDGKEGNGYYG